MTWVTAEESLNALAEEKKKKKFWMKRRGAPPGPRPHLRPSGECEATELRLISVAAVIGCFPCCCSCCCCALWQDWRLEAPRFLSLLPSHTALTHPGGSAKNKPPFFFSFLQNKSGYPDLPPSSLFNPLLSLPSTTLCHLPLYLGSCPEQKEARRNPACSGPTRPRVWS